MMKLIISLTLLWTISSSVGALQCQSCSDRQCMNMTTVTCSSETMCVSATTKARTVGNTRNEFLKACAPSSLCPSTGNRTFQSNSGLSNTVTLAECCNTDNCNTRTLPAPSRNETKSGLSCHFCANPSVCDVELQCEGSEDRCFRANGVNGGRTPTVGGCVSTNLVETNSSLQRFSQLLNVGNFSSISSCSGNLCLNLNTPPVTTASSNTISQASSGSTSKTTASGTSGGSGSGSGGSGSGSGSSGASTTASGGSGSGSGGSGSGSGGSGASTTASGGSGSGSGSGATTTVSSGSSSQSIDAGFIRLGMINLLFGLFTVILC
ncbi:cell wall protein IFF6-like [Gouania willdenowi]|uniref:cell wall protein IFF6-like n=1 Tax=Gouania willdenowi TaxID=441366 RepID=UPI0010553387|nr:cell wall protein IFF6-like [Gouania willdenowi]